MVSDQQFPEQAKPAPSHTLALACALLRCRGDIAQRHARRIGPKIFQPIERSGFLIKQMHDHLAAIHEDPLRLAPP